LASIRPAFNTQSIVSSSLSSATSGTYMNTINGSYISNNRIQDGILVPTTEEQTMLSHVRELLNVEFDSYDKKFNNGLKAWIERVSEEIDEATGNYRQISQIGPFLKKFNEVTEELQESREIIKDLKDLVLQQKTIITDLSVKYKLLTDSTSVPDLTHLHLLSQLPNALASADYAANLIRSFIGSDQYQKGYELNMFKQSIMNVVADNCRIMFNTEQANEFANSIATRASNQSTLMSQHYIKQELISFMDVLENMGVIPEKEAQDPKKE